MTVDTYERKIERLRSKRARMFAWVTFGTMMLVTAANLAVWWFDR